MYSSVQQSSSDKYSVFVRIIEFLSRLLSHTHTIYTLFTAEFTFPQTILNQAVQCVNINEDTRETVKRVIRNIDKIKYRTEKITDVRHVER